MREIPVTVIKEKIAEKTEDVKEKIHKEHKK